MRIVKTRCSLPGRLKLRVARAIQLLTVALLTSLRFQTTSNQTHTHTHTPTHTHYHSHTNSLSVDLSNTRRQLQSSRLMRPRRWFTAMVVNIGNPLTGKCLKVSHFSFSKTNNSNRYLKLF